MLVSLFACQSTKQVAFKSTGLAQLTEEDRHEFLFNYYEGIKFKEEFEYDQAHEAFLKSYAVDSTDAGLNAELAGIKFSLGESNTAIGMMEQALKQDPDNWWYNMQLMFMYMGMENHEGAIDIGEHLLAKYPEREQSYYMLIHLYKENNQIDKAIGLYDKLEKITGVNEKIVFEKISLYIHEDKPKKAIQELDKIIAKFPKENKYKVLKGDLLSQQGKLVEALETYQEVVTDEPGNPYVYVSLSEYYKAIDNKDESLQYMIIALKNGQLDLDTKLEILRKHLESILKAKANIDDTEDLFQILINYYPLEEAVHGYYAAFLEYIGKEKEALQVYESMLSINNENRQTWLDIIQIHFTLRDYHEVINTTIEAIELAGDELVFYLYKGLAEIVLSDYLNAKMTYLTAIETFNDEDNPSLKSDICMHLGDVYMELEESRLAFQAYDESLKYNADNVPVLNNYAYYLSLQNVDLQKAERMSSKTVEKEPKNSTYLDTYAWIFYMQGNYSLAKFYIERAVDNLKEEESRGVILDHYGDILWMSGEEHHAKAIEIWQKAYDSGYQPEALKMKIINKTQGE